MKHQNLAHRARASVDLDRIVGLVERLPRGGARVAPKMENVVLERGQERLAVGGHEAVFFAVDAGVALEQQLLEIASEGPEGREQSMTLRGLGIDRERKLTPLVDVGDILRGRRQEIQVHRDRRR